jgi:hypothetical protein
MSWNTTPPRSKEKCLPPAPKLPSKGCQSLKHRNNLSRAELDDLSCPPLGVEKSAAGLMHPPQRLRDVLSEKSLQIKDWERKLAEAERLVEELSELVRYYESFPTRALGSMESIRKPVIRAADDEANRHLEALAKVESAERKAEEEVLGAQKIELYEDVVVGLYQMLQ